MHETIVDDSSASGQTLPMGRPKQFDERIQLTLVEGTTARVDALLGEDEYRLDFIRTAIEAEIEKRMPRSSLSQPGGQKKHSLANLVASTKKR